MMLLRIEQQKIRILKMSRDFTDLPTDKLADLKKKRKFRPHLFAIHIAKIKKMKGKSAVKKLRIFYLSYIPNPYKN